MICNYFCNLHTISNNCAKIIHPRSKNEIGVGLTSHKLVVSIFDIDLAVIRNLYCNQHTIDNHCAI